jgi:hypothetical protein
MQANPAEALQVLEQQEHAAMMQAEALLKVQEGLVNGRKWLWDEAARKLGTLLSSPAAFEGEHFLQVRTVTGRVLQIGSLFVPLCFDMLDVISWMLAFKDALASVEDGQGKRSPGLDAAAEDDD